MKIRRAVVSDIKQCVKLSRQEGQRYWQAEDFNHCLKSKDVELFVAEEESEILGYSSGFIVPTKRTEALLHETRVHTDHRRKDIGTKLVKAVSDALFKKGVKIIYAMIESKRLSFYRDSCKFKESGKWIEVSKKKE
jgi:ribosomal protein S18 acetylase RimI-like enzyme